MLEKVLLQQKKSLMFRAIPEIKNTNMEVLERMQNENFKKKYKKKL